jgi:class 3 adenylate cyclase
MSKPTRVGRRRKSRAAKIIEGDAFLLQASVLVCSAASLGWTALQIVLYGGSEPAMVVVPLMYNVIVYGAVAYERFYLRVRPFRVLVHAHLTAVAVLPAMLEMETGGFAKSGGVLGWAAVSPFTAMVVLREKTTQLRYVGLFVTVVVAAIAHEVAWRVEGQAGRALFWSHSVETWPWQIYLYYVATLLGVAANGVILMKMLQEKSENAIHAHKMLACSIMPPPVAKEVFELQWSRLQEGKMAARAVAVGVRRRFNAVHSGGANGRFGTNRRETFAERLLGPLLRAIMGDDTSDSGSRGAGGSSRTSSVVSFSQLCGSRSLGARGPGVADDDTHSAHSGLSRQTGSVSMGSDTNVSVSSMDNLGRQNSDAETFDEASGSDVASVFERRSRKTGGEKRAKSARVSFDAPPPLHVPPSARVKSAARTIDRDVLGQLRSSASRGASGKRSSSGVRARDHADVTVIFVDIVGFSDMCKRTRPIGVLRFLEHYFESLDKVAEEHGVTKVRTVGDGYLAVSGLMADMGVAQDAHRHVLRAMTFGLGVIQEIKDTGMLLADGQPLVVRVGMAHGPVFSGVVGRTCMQYDIFGDTPNLAARMEQTCPHDAVHMPAESFEKMKADLGEALASEFEALRFETHARVEIKNMGRVDTVSLAFRGNEESIERVLAGAIGDDDNRAVAAHIGVMADQLRNAKWGPAENRTRRESHDASSGEGAGSEEDARYGDVSSELEDEASRRAEGEVDTTSGATGARLSSEHLVSSASASERESQEARPGASADVVVDVREGAPADGNE